MFQQPTTKTNARSTKWHGNMAVHAACPVARLVVWSTGCGLGVRRKPR